MAPKPFHHGNLRVELMDRAETVLRERGVEALSLRELARDAGVSHGAPRSHFADRGALLDALAERGFDHLNAALQAALQRDDGLPARLRAAANAYVGFAVGEPALLDLMYAAKVEARGDGVHDAATRLFATMSSLIAEGVDAGVLTPAATDGDVVRFTMLVSALFQGIASLVTSGRIDRLAGDQLVDDAIALLTTAPHA